MEAQSALITSRRYGIALHYFYSLLAIKLSSYFMPLSSRTTQVLLALFGGSVPQVGSSPGGLPGSSTDTGPSTGASTGSSTGASTVASTGSDASARWYPDYNSDWSLGKCLNDAPAPSGRPSYDTGTECCGKAYGSQASGNCLSSLPQAPSLPNGSAGSSAGLGSLPQGPRPTRQPVSPDSEVGMVLGSKTFIDMENVLESAKGEIDSKLFLYQTPAFQWIPSSVYRYDDFKESLYVMATEGVAGKKFYIGDSSAENGHVYGLVNIAAFLAQSMKETIQYDACDENR